MKHLYVYSILFCLFYSIQASAIISYNPQIQFQNKLSNMNFQVTGVTLTNVLNQDGKFCNNKLSVRPNLPSGNIKPGSSLKVLTECNSSNSFATGAYTVQFNVAINQSATSTVNCNIQVSWNVSIPSPHAPPIYGPADTGSSSCSNSQFQLQVGKTTHSYTNVNVVSN